MIARSVITAVERGAVVDLWSLKPAELTAEQLAGPLSRINRFNGRTPVPWSVAAHSLVVMGLVEAQGGSEMAQAAGLLHDGHEAFLGDWTTPAVQFAGQQSLPVGPSVVRSCIDQAKKCVDDAIARAWGVEFTPNITLTRIADQAALEAEMIHFLDWQGPVVTEPALLAQAMACLTLCHELTEHQTAKEVWMEALEGFVTIGVLTDPGATLAA
ncbi:hypothetical protein [Loktanella sp. 3ANDIMAR09]|uniref:hypothetical protein n=1 Tax=Loktanella sp. 3ANDIMAR09 TaxID=1225657 RepID=UPI000701B9E4|nr:hypothetical protein [Loktanella sp. 3ANDIMAR09]